MYGKLLSPPAAFLLVSTKDARCKTSGIINVKMLANRNLIGYYFLPEVYEKEVSKQEIKVLRMLLLDVFDHVRDGQWERNLKMGDAN